MRRWHWDESWVWLLEMDLVRHDGILFVVKVKRFKSYAEEVGIQYEDEEYYSI